MHRLLVVMLVLVGCGGRHPPPSAPPPVAPAPVAPLLVTSAVATPALDAGRVATPTWVACCGGGDSWICDRLPEPDEDCSAISGGCCQGGSWTCDRLPEPGECDSPFR